MIVATIIKNKLSKKNLPADKFSEGDKISSYVPIPLLLY